jgi:flavin reductase (DIM6/NTAB) family NADH-FMN oxidoreductase RutF
MINNKRLLEKKIPLIQPSPICVVGTVIQGRSNFTTIGDIAVAGLNPPLVMISINANHACMEHINQQKPFSINIPSQSLMAQVDFAGMNSATKVNKENLFEVDVVDGLPIIKEAPINLIVEEHSRLQIEHRVVIVCHVLKTYVNEALFSGNQLSLQGLKSIYYGLDNKYYSLNEMIGEGYKEGRKIEVNPDK